MAFNPALHGLRGIAALAVLLFHWEQFFPAMSQRLESVELFDSSYDLSMQIGFGWMGVPLFFILSGLLLTGLLQTQPINRSSVLGFYKRRLLRIYPAVWVQLLVLLGLASLVPGLFSDFDLKTLIANGVLWINMPGSMVRPLNLVWWTLPIELSFYLILPALILLTRAIGWPLMVLAGFLTTLTWRFWVFESNDVDNYLSVLPLLDFLPGTLNSFTLGLGLAFLPRIESQNTKVVTLLLGLGSLFVLQKWQLSLDDVYWTGHWIIVVWVPAVAMALAIIIHSLITPPAGLAFIKSKTAIWFGECSFGIYLWHFPVFQLMNILFSDHWTTPVGSCLALVLNLAVTLPLARLSYFYIERPLMGWGRSRTSKP